MKKFFYVAIAALLVACGGGGGSDAPQQPESVRVAIYGDSIFFGYELPTSPVAEIKKARPDWQIDERYAGGLRLQQLIDGYKEPFNNAAAWTYPAGPQPAFKDVVRHEKISILEAGVNDTFADASKCEQNLRTAITILLSEGRIPVLTGIIGLELQNFNATVQNQWHACNTATYALAKEFDLEHAGWDKDYRGPQDIMPDRVHRTLDASNRLAALLVAAIDRALVKEPK